MPRIEVKTAGLATLSTQSKAVSNSIGDIEASFSSIISSLDWDIKGAAGVQATANSITTSLKRAEESTKKLSNFFTQAQTEYEKLDSMETPDVLEEDTAEGNSSAWKDFILDLIEKVGPLGELISGVGNLIAGFFGDGLFSSWETGFDTLKTLLTAGEGIYGIYELLAGTGTKNLSTLWQGLVGWVPIEGMTTGLSNLGSNITTAIKEELGIGVESTGKAIAKWAGVALEFAQNAVSNFQEWQSGEIGGFRAVAETGMETALGVGFSALVMAAAGTVGAPAVVGGLAVVGIGAAANWVYKAAGGEKSSLKEAVSDGILDAGEAVVDAVVDAADWVADKTKNLISSIGNVFTTSSSSTKWGFSFA